MNERAISIELLRHYIFLAKAAHAGSLQLIRMRIKLREKGVLQESRKKDFWESWVTEADIASQNAILKELQQDFPEDIIIAEENDTVLDGGGRAHIFVDPCDGTKYFRDLRLPPTFSVSIGRWHEQCAIGIIVQPMFSKVYFGALYGTEKIAELHGIKESVSLTVSATNCVDKARILLCQPEKYTAIHAALCEAGFAVEHAGPCTFACVAIAEGQADAYVAPGGIGRGGMKHPNMKWGFAAGVPLAVAAGGEATTISGDELPLGHSSLLLSNGSALHGQLIEVLRRLTPENNFGRD